MTSTADIARALHGRVCMSEPCPDPDDHARRTQTAAAAKIRKAGPQQSAILLHDAELLHLGTLPLSAASRLARDEALRGARDGGGHHRAVVRGGLTLRPSHVYPCVMSRITLLLVLLFALSISTLFGAIFDDGNRAVYSISTIAAHALLIAVGYVAARRRYNQ